MCVTWRCSAIKSLQTNYGTTIYINLRENWVHLNATLDVRHLNAHKSVATAYQDSLGCLKALLSI